MSGSIQANLEASRGTILDHLRSQPELLEIQKLTSCVQQVTIMVRFKISYLHEGSTHTELCNYTAPQQCKISYSQLPTTLEERILFFRQRVISDFPSTTYSRCAAKRSLVELIAENYALLQYTPTEESSSRTFQSMKDSATNELRAAGISLEDFFRKIQDKCRSQGLTTPAIPTSDQEWKIRHAEISPTILLQNVSNFPQEQQADYKAMRRQAVEDLTNILKIEQKNMVLSQVYKAFEKFRSPISLKNPTNLSLDKFKITVFYSPENAPTKSWDCNYP